MTALADRLTGPTVRNAARLPLYRDLWAGIDLDGVRTSADLARLPLVDKAAAQALFDGFSHDACPGLLSHSSGTSGAITVRCRSRAELEFLWAFHREHAEADPGQDEAPLPLVLGVDCANHGQQVVLPSRGFGLKAVGFDDDVIDHVIQQLTRTYRFPGVTPRVHTIQSSLGFLKKLTVDLLARRIDPKELGPKLLVTFGEYLTDFWARRIEEIWGAALIDRYSCSEVIGGAQRCRQCGCLSFDPPCFPQVVDVATRRDVREGVGLLVLTELYPFSQLQPLVRFLPGDLVEARPSTCDGRPGRIFRFLGRADRALRDDARRGHPILLYPSELACALDELPEIVREREFHRLRLDPWSADIAAPLAAISLDRALSPPVIRLGVCPKFSRFAYPEAASALVARIEALLRRRCTGLPALLDEGRYRLSVVLHDDERGLRPFTAS